MPASLVTVRDTLSNPDDTPVIGTITICGSPFTSADGYTILGSQIVRNLLNGQIDVALVPNAGATPSGTTYQVLYQLQNGVSYYEYWSIPSSGPVTVSQVRVAPAALPPAQVLEQQLALGAGMQASFAFALKQVSANYTMQGTLDCIVLADGTSGPVTVTLPPAATAMGLLVQVTRKYPSAGSNVTVLTQGSDTFNVKGGPFVQAALIGGTGNVSNAVTLFSDGVSTWYPFAGAQGTVTYS